MDQRSRIWRYGRYSAAWVQVSATLVFSLPDRVHNVVYRMGARQREALRITIDVGREARLGEGKVYPIDTDITNGI